MDSEGNRIHYEVEIGNKGEMLFKHLFPYAAFSFLEARKKDCVRMNVAIPADMQKTFEDSFRRKFTEAVCDKLPTAA